MLRMRRSKGDQEGEGADVGIARGSAPGDLPGARDGGLAAPRGDRLWRGVPPAHRGGHDRRPADRQRRVEDPAAPGGAAGLTVDDGERLSPHGLRAGFITEAYLHGALDEQVQRPRPPEERHHHAALPQPRQDRRRQPDQAAGSLSRDGAAARRCPADRALVG